MKRDLPAEVLPQLPPRRMMKALLTLIVAAFLLVLIACSGEKGDKEPTVTVQVVPVEKTTIQHVIKTQAILFPRQQAAIVSKISAPVQRFLIKRGSPVHKGQVLAILENRDLSAAAQEKIYQSRQQLYQEGALPRKELDQSGVEIVQARNQYSITKRHLDTLQAIGRQQELKAAAGQLELAKGKYLGAEAQLSYSEIRSPIDGVITDRPLYPGEMAAVGTAVVTV